MKKQQAVFFLASGLIFAALAVWLLPRFLSQKPLPFSPQVPRVSLTLCVPRQMTAGLIFVADAKGYFAKEGVEVTLRESISGRRALEDMQAGNFEMASAAEVPVALYSFERNSFKAIAILAEGFNVLKVAVRTDRGILRPDDLKGKHVAVQERAASHFFLSSFLNKYGFEGRDLRLSFMDFEKIPGALSRGEIDAAVLREPLISQARAQVGKEVRFFEAPGLYTMLEVLVVQNDFLKKEPAAVEAVLRALLRAEDFMKEFPEDAGAILGKRFNIDPEAMALILADLNYEVFLDQALFNYLEALARWMIEEKIVEGAELPDFLKKVEAAPLRNVKKERLRNIR